MAQTKNTIEEMLDNITTDSFESAEDCARAAIAAERLVARLQSPWEQIQKLTWTMPAYAAALKVFVDTGLFDEWDPSKVLTVDELSTMSGIEKELMERLVRHVAAMNGLVDLGDDRYMLTGFTASLAGSGNSSCFQLMFEAVWPSFLNLPAFLEKTSYRNPIDPQNTNWEDMHPGSQGYIEFVKSTTQRTESFHEMMVAYHASNDNWMDHYPLATVLKDLKPERAVLVDAGGGRGFDIERFRARYNTLPKGSLILQDLPHVIETIKVHDDIEPMAQDLFESQPVHGSRIYFTHLCFHGWSDKDAVRVLQNLATAMESGYSKLVLVEKIIHRHLPSVHTTAMDMSMMAVLSSSERSEKTWRQLLDQAGLKITQIYTSPALYDSIIEAELA